jgi:hypothetical protein
MPPLLLDRVRGNSIRHDATPVRGYDDGWDNGDDGSTHYRRRSLWRLGFQLGPLQFLDLRVFFGVTSAALGGPASNINSRAGLIQDTVRGIRLRVANTIYRSKV